LRLLARIDPLVVPYILAICFCGVFCLIPLAMYLLWLARITRRDHPTPVAGAWDFTGVVLGLSGFIIFGGGLLLSLLQSNFRYWMRGNVEALRAAWVQERVTWMLLVGFYLTVVLGWIALTLLVRRRSLVVYNVDPAVFENTLIEVFDQLGCPVERRGKLWVGASPLFELDTFEGGRTVTIRWVSNDQRLFEDVVRMIRTALATQPGGDNAASRWIMSAAVGTSVIVACSFGLLLYGLSLLGR
jgi:hypothetical protein